MLGLESVSFEILRNEGKNPEDSIASFEISKIGVKLQISSQAIMKVDASIQAITLMDTRPNTESKFPVSLSVYIVLLYFTNSGKGTSWI